VKSNHLICRDRLGTSTRKSHTRCHCARNADAPVPLFPVPGWNGLKGSCNETHDSNCSVARGAYAGVCARLLVRYTGVCLLVGAGLGSHVVGTPGYHRGWSVVVAENGNCRSWTWQTLGSGALARDFDLTAFNNLSLSVVGNVRAAIIFYTRNGRFRSAQKRQDNVHLFRTPVLWKLPSLPRVPESPPRFCLIKPLHWRC
jgi:hypothetical protein